MYNEVVQVLRVGSLLDKVKCSMKAIEIIHIEDDPLSVDLVTGELTHAGILFNTVVVSSKEEFNTSLDKSKPDIILSDHCLKAFGSIEALEIIKERNLDIPFILITGNTSEEFGVSVMKAGADDYIVKDRMKRLPSAMLNALEKFKLSGEKGEHERDGQKKNDNSNGRINRIARRLKQAAKSAGVGIWEWDIATKHLRWDDGMFQLYEIESCEFECSYDGWMKRVHPDDRRRVDEDMQLALSGKAEYVTEYRILCRNDVRHISASGVVERDSDGNAVNMIGVSWDTTRQATSENTLVSTSKALHSAINELNKIMDSSLDVICTINGLGEFVNLSSASERIFGFRPKELLGKKYINHVVPDDVEITNQVAAEIMNGHPVTTFENRYIRKDGRFVPIMWSATWDSDDKLMYCIAKDVTDRKLAEQRLLIQERRYRSLIENGADGVAILSPTGNLKYISPTVKRILGYDEEEMMEMNLFSLLHPNDAGSIDRVWRQIISSPGVPVAGNIIQVMHKDGSWRYHAATFTNMLHDTSINGIVDNFRDITEKMEGEKIRKFEQINKEALINATDDKIWSVGGDFKLITANKAFIKSIHEQFGVTVKPGDVLVNRDIFEPASFQFWNELYARAFSGEFFIEEIFLPAVERDLTGWEEIKFNPIYDGEIIAGVACYSRNITDRKVAEIKLNELNQDLERHAKKLAISNAELEQFAYVASHDLQEPLRMITSFLVQLEKKYESIIDDKGRKYIAFAVDGAKRMRQIILDLLEFSRVGRSDVGREKLDLNALVDDIRILFHKGIEEKNATIVVDKLPTLQAYKAPLQQVFQNLIGNALKYSRNDRPAEIKIGVAEFADHWQFSVKDNGIGIEAEYFEKIFVIFQRLHNKEEYSGTGMGLAITKKIIETLGGEIWVESEEGSGSSFYFTLLKN